MLIIFPRQSWYYKLLPWHLIPNFPNVMVLLIITLWSPRKTLRILPTGNLLFSGKQRMSLSTNFPVHVNEGKLVDKKVLCLPLNFPLTCHMHSYRPLLLLLRYCLPLFVVTLCVTTGRGFPRFHHSSSYAHNPPAQRFPSKPLRKREEERGIDGWIGGWMWGVLHSGVNAMYQHS